MADYSRYKTETFVNTKGGRKQGIDIMKCSQSLKREKDRPTLKPCSTCGVKPVIEHWRSGGPIFAVRCNNPDRPDSCDRAFYYSRSKTPAEAIQKWNEFQEHPLTFEEMRERE